MREFIYMGKGKDTCLKASEKTTSLHLVTAGFPSDWLSGQSSRSPLFVWRLLKFSRSGNGTPVAEDDKLEVHTFSKNQSAHSSVWQYSPRLYKDRTARIISQKMKGQRKCHAPVSYIHWQNCTLLIWLIMSALATQYIALFQFHRRANTGEKMS